MANESKTGNGLLRGGEGDPPLIRTFKIVGGTSFQLTIENQPTLLHYGLTTVWTMLGTQAEVDQITEKIRCLCTPVKLDVFCTLQTKEQLAIRRARLGIFVGNVDELTTEKRSGKNREIE